MWINVVDENTIDTIKETIFKICLEIFSLI